MTVPEEVRAEVAEREALVGNELVDLGGGWQVARDRDGRLRLRVGRRCGALLDGFEAVLTPEDAVCLAAALGGGGAPAG